MYVVLVSAPAHVSFITKAYIYVLLSNFLHPKEQKKRKWDRHMHPVCSPLFSRRLKMFHLCLETLPYSRWKSILVGMFFSSECFLPQLCFCLKKAPGWNLSVIDLLKNTHTLMIRSPLPSPLRWSFFILYLLSLHFYCSLKMECEKLAQEKTEMQRHYVMVSIGRLKLEKN